MSVLNQLSKRVGTKYVFLCMRIPVKQYNTRFLFISWAWNKICLHLVSELIPYQMIRPKHTPFQLNGRNSVALLKKKKNRKKKKKSSP